MDRHRKTLTGHRPCFGRKKTERWLGDCQFSFPIFLLFFSLVFCFNLRGNIVFGWFLWQYLFTFRGKFALVGYIRPVVFAVSESGHRENNRSNCEFAFTSALTWFVFCVNCGSSLIGLARVLCLGSEFFRENTFCSYIKGYEIEIRLWPPLVSTKEIKVECGNATRTARTGGRLQLWHWDVCEANQEEYGSFESMSTVFCTLPVCLYVKWNLISYFIWRCRRKSLICSRCFFNRRDTMAGISLL